METVRKITQLSLKEAKRLSIIKWESHVKAVGDEWHYPSEIRSLCCHCGFCERWNMECEQCEFGKIAGDCTEDNSIYNLWYCDRNIENDQAILEIIKSIPDE